MTPYEIITAPLSVYIAPIGEAFPAIDAAPAGNWVLLGTNGDRNYDEGGVTVAHSKTYNKIRVAGATGPVKADLDQEDLMVRLTLLDMSPEQYAYALNGNDVTTTAAGSGTAGFKSVGLSQSVGRTAEFALLCRGLSPEDESMNCQFELPRVFDSGQPSIVFRKGQAAGIALEFSALEDLSASSEDERFGRFIAQHQEPLA
jgi:hypothetical protein